MESANLRIALISSVERTPEGDLRAFQRIGGRTVIAWQVDLARELGCERIVCLSEGASPELIDLQRESEASGLRFNMIRGPLHLVGLVSADHDIVAIADGLVLERSLASVELADKRGILALPAEDGIAAGFERIDAEYAWAGLFVARANIAAQLADLPPDSDTMSVLLRLALQAGTRRVPVGKERLDSGELLLAMDRSELVRREKALLDHGGPSVPWSAPGKKAANWLARRFAPEGLARGPAIAGVSASVLGIGAVALSWVDQAFYGLLALSAGAIALGMGQCMSGMKARLLGQPEKAKLRRISNSLLDILGVCVLILPSLPFMLPRRAFLPLVLIGLLHLASRSGSARWKAMWNDRVLLFVTLAPAAWFGFLTQAMAVIVLAALVYCLISGRKSPITTD